MDSNQNLLSNNKKYNRIVLFLTWAIILLQTNLFRFKYWSGDISHFFNYALFMYIAFCLFKYKAITKSNFTFKKIFCCY